MKTGRPKEGKNYIQRDNKNIRRSQLNKLGRTTSKLTTSIRKTSIKLKNNLRCNVRRNTWLYHKTGYFIHTFRRCHFNICV